MRHHLWRGVATAVAMAMLSVMGAGRAEAGPIFITGHDPDFHAQGEIGADHLLKAGVTFVRHGSGLPLLWVESRIAVPPGHRVGKNGLLSIGMVQGVDFVAKNGADLAALTNADWAALAATYSAIGVASDFGGILTQAELDQLNAHKTDIANFVNAGGGVMALSESGTSGALTTHDRFGFLPVTVVTTGSASPPYVVTPYGQANFGLVNADVNSASHSHFNAAFGLNVVSTSAPTGQIMTLAGQVGITACGFIVANAGPDQMVTGSPNANVKLDGSASTVDPMCSPLTYLWSEGGLPIATGVSPTVTLPPGTHTITLKVTDARGNTASDTVVITVTVANQPPVAHCTNPTVAADQNCAGCAPTACTGTDPDGDVVTCMESPSCATGTGPHGYTCTCTDSFGLTASCSGTITVADNTPPSIQCPANQTDECIDGGANASFMPTVTDNCGQTSVNCQPPSGSRISYSPPGPTCIPDTCTATDNAGNKASCTFSVCVKDTTPPEARCQSVTVFADGACQGCASIDAGSSDSCGPVTCTQSPGCPFTGVGAHTVTLTCKDGAGNTSSCTGTITVVDTTPPMIQCPPDQVDECTNGGAVASFMPMTADNCGIAMTACQPPSGSKFPYSPPGPTCTPDTCTTTDTSGNQTSCAFKVCVQDTTPPLCLCQNRVVTADQACQGCASVDNGSSDSCGPVKVSQSPDCPFTGVGPHAVTQTCTDGAGNTSTCTATVTIVDLTPPTIQCPANQLDECMDLGAFACFPPPAIHDNCPGVTAACAPPSCSFFGFSPPGPTCTPDTCGATDASGNTASCIFDVCVEATRPPVIELVPGGVTLWPPDHKYQNVKLSDCVKSVTSPCFGNLDIQSAAVGHIKYVRSDEPEDDNGNGDGHTCDDMVINGDNSVNLRAERDGGAPHNGRVYTIDFTVTDPSGNTTAGECLVNVVHDQSGRPAVNDGCQTGRQWNGWCTDKVGGGNLEGGPCSADKDASQCDAENPSCNY